MREEFISIKVWPALSFALLFTFVNLSLYIFLAFKSGFPIYFIMIISSLTLPTFAIFLELSGIREKLWNIWKSWPVVVHKIICGICAFWIGFLSFKALIPAIKKNYEKN